MDNLRPEENLTVIRTLMERSALYRRALAPIMAVTGAIGVIAAALARFCPAPFIHYWSAVALGASLTAVWMVRRQAFKEHETFWSPPTRRVAQALALPFGAGLLITIPSLRNYADAVHEWLTLSLWLVFYGCGLHAAGFFTLRGLRWLGIGFALAGVCLFVALTSANGVNVDGLGENRVMGVTFGGFHLAYALYLYATRNRGQTP